jgi:hypothetical protein
MNPLILLFKTYYSPLFLFGYGVEGVLCFISQADIADPVYMDTVYRNISKRDLYLRCF